MTNPMTQAANNRDNYVESAGEAPTTAPAAAPQKLLIASGQLKDRKDNYKMNSIYIHHDLSQWIDSRTMGTNQLVMNHLLRLGIEALEKSGQPLIFEGFDGLKK